MQLFFTNAIAAIAALNFNNLFDEDYFESAYDEFTVYPAEPFTVQGTVSYEF